MRGKRTSKKYTELKRINKQLNTPQCNFFHLKDRKDTSKKVMEKILKMKGMTTIMILEIPLMEIATRIRKFHFWTI